MRNSSTYPVVSAHQKRMKEDKICSICKITIQENYCSRCGQEASGKKTTTINLITDFLSNFFSLEKSVFATIFKLLMNPKPIVDNYYLGFKNYYSSPGKILLYSIATITLHITFVNPNVLGMVINVKNLNTQYFFWIMHLPIVLIISYLAFINNKENFSKHLISIIYISGSAFIVFTIINDLIILIAGDMLGNLAFIIFLLFTFIWNSRVFSKKDKQRYLILNTLLQLGIYIIIVLILICTTSNITLN